MTRKRIWMAAPQSFSSLLGSYFESKDRYVMGRFMLD